MKQYSLLNQTKAEDFAFSIDILEHDCEVPVHTHDCMELVIIIDGKAVHIVDGEEYELKVGDVFVINTHSEHGYISACSLKLCNIMFDFKQLEQIDIELTRLPGFKSLFILEPILRKEHKFKSKLQLNPTCMNFVKVLVDQLCKEYENQRDGFKSTIRAYFTALVIYLSRLSAEPKNNVSGKLINLANAISYIENKYLEQVNISSAATIAYLSTRQFNRVFRKNYNMSPKEYLIKLRLENACSLMRTDSMKLSQIAIDSGFSDISFFSRQFKSKFGMSPKEYRKQLTY